MKAGPALIWAGVCLFVVIVAAYVVLIVAGRPTAELSGLLDWVLRALTGAGVLGAAGAATSAARSSHTAATRLNGTLETRMEAAAGRRVHA
jgi:hypothetical protein